MKDTILRQILEDSPHKSKTYFQYIIMGIFDSLKEKALEQAQQLASKAQAELHNSKLRASNETVSEVTEQPTRNAQQEETSISQLYDPRLEQLINAALADGVLTEKEKQVLYKKAEALGIDLDEFEMVLDAKLYEKQHKPTSTTAHQSAPKSEKYGDVRKCPSCGAIVESFTAVCPDCDYQFTNVGTVSSFTSLSKKLEELNKSISGGLFSFYTDKKIDEKKKSVIANFPVPTAKEDILEFLVMAAPLATRKKTWYKLFEEAEDEHIKLRSSWRAKCEQVIIKARFSLKNDPETLAQIEQIAKELNIK